VGEADTGPDADAEIADDNFHGS
jgi:hypothetical protein